LLLILLRELSGELLKISKALHVNAYFSKHDYVEAALGCSLTFVSSLRSNAMYYPCTGEKTGKKGHPKINDGQVDKKSLRLELFTRFLIHGVVYIKYLKITARVMIVPQQDEKEWVDFGSYRIERRRYYVEQNIALLDDLAA